MTYNQEAGPHEGNFLVSNIVSGIKVEQKIGEIKFKVKEDVKAGTTTEIKFKNITSNDGGNLVKESDKSVLIKIIGEPANTNTANNSNNTPIMKNNINTNSIKNVSQNNIPYTGTNAIIKIAILLVGITATFTYMKYKKVKY